MNTNEIITPYIADISSVLFTGLGIVLGLAVCTTAFVILISLVKQFLGMKSGFWDSKDY